MHTLFRAIFKSAERERENSRELLDQEQNFLDHEVNEETIEQENKFNAPATGNIKQKATNENGNTDGNPDGKADGVCCSARKGVITHLTDKSGTIDKTLHFDKPTAESIFQDLHSGCVVEYLAYQNENNELKVVKIQKIVDYNWEDTSDEKVQNMLESLKIENPTYFNMQLRNILGVITSRMSSGIKVDTDYGELVVELENVELNFMPKMGDNVCLECNVQLDEGYVDKQGEILQVKKVFPVRMELEEKCIVEGVFEEFAVFTGNAYVLKEDIPKSIDLHLGDIVKADLIECKYSKFSRRVIKLTLLEKNFAQVKNSFPETKSKQAISVLGEDRFIFTELWKKQNVTLKVQNNINRTFMLRSILIPNAADAQISVVEPVNSTQIEIGGQITIIFEVHTKLIGESKESFTLDFESFKVRRSLTIVVCETEEEAREANRRLVASEQLMVAGRSAAQRSRLYANQVWSNKNTVVAGESYATKRRFVPVRLGAYDVPDRLRNIILTSERRDVMLETLDSEYSFCKEVLSYKNYERRFGLMLHLEEIDYYVSFRNYDRERAHFQRDGEFLSLQIENLAERRPSLVLGDTVRAINPWADANSKENKSFEGIVHKVLFNRVLLKFNANFQQKYNGEDYRLEFGFSRFSFRKQHYAVGRIVFHLGEQFLFPSKVTKREHPQLDVTFKDDQMFLYDDKLNWYNNSLNSIQKRAVYNILRGETENMPYVIFGPPGTGKTVTLVETILQLIRNLPNSRLLVGTPSNSSADLITKRIIDSKVLPQGDFIRLVSQNLIEKDLIPPELMSHCATVDIGTVDSSHDSMIVTESGLKLRCQMKFMGQHRVTISTCTTLGNFIQMGFPAGHFTHVLIDEAGQCTEPETVVPIVLLAQQRSQVILAGDPHQLQSIVISRCASDFGLRVSFLERLLERSPYCKDMQRFPNSSGFNPSVLTKLLYNYRALPSIMAVYSKLFYDNELIAEVSDQDSSEAKLLGELQSIFEPQTGMPRTHGTFFHGILGENMQEADSPSWYNPVEAREVFLLTILLYRRNVHPDQIGILTPYAKQVKTLRNLFIGADITMPKIGSVEEFQGQERDIMLISTVRSSKSILHTDSRLNLGFVRCNKRMNVAISRARCLMVIFGNPYLLCVDDCWRHLILYCANNNAYFGCEMPNSILSQEDDSDALSSKSDDGFD